MLLIKVICLGGVILEYHDSSLLKERKVSLKVTCLFIFTNSILVKDNRGKKWQLQILPWIPPALKRYTKRHPVKAERLIMNLFAVAGKLNYTDWWRPHSRGFAREQMIRISGGFYSLIRQGYALIVLLPWTWPNSEEIWRMQCLLCLHGKK